MILLERIVARLSKLLSIVFHIEKSESVSRETVFYVKHFNEKLGYFTKMVLKSVSRETCFT